MDQPQPLPTEPESPATMSPGPDDSPQVAVGQPCMHPRADHQHGTIGAYRADGCRCEPCLEANLSFRRVRARRLMSEDSSPFTPAGPVREHLARLRSAGVGVDRIAQIAGVPGSTVRELIYGSGGRRFKRVRRDIAERIFDTRPATHSRSDRSTVDSTETRALIQSVYTRGVPWAMIAEGLGRSPASLRRTLQRSRVTVKTAAEVARFCSSFRSHNKLGSELAVVG